MQRLARRGPGRQPAVERWIDLERDEPARALGQALGEDPRPGADLAHDVGRRGAHGRDDPVRQGLVDEEVLTERLAARPGHRPAGGESQPLPPWTPPPGGCARRDASGRPAPPALPPWTPPPGGADGSAGRRSERWPARCSARRAW